MVPVLFTRSIAESETLIAGKTDSLECRNQAFNSTRHQTFLIGVFDAQYEVTPLIFGKQITVESGA